ncbi:MAG: DUF1446 domain-containing protein [Defluviitaleaceae bacterium]|nr:DUF1446 domain-containing protein [Defluviitaleaceae bacterium]
MRELRVLSPTAILGYGFPESSFEEGMRRKPHVIAVDAGSTDPGPYYLGSGKCFVDRANTKRDLEFMLQSACQNNIPLIIGTGGGSGATPHLQRDVDIIKEIAKEKGLSFKMAIISSQIDKSVVVQALEKGALKALFPAPLPTKESIEQSTNIVAQMGPEPFLKALEQGAQVIISGRAYDPVVFAAVALKEGYDPGLAMHMGKILECAAIAASPGSGSDCMFGTLRDDHFELDTLCADRKCTTVSVAAHTLYEKSTPTSLPGPGGVLDLTETTFEQKTESAVIVRGTKYIKDENYHIKLEGARSLGYRTISFAAVADPVMIAEMENILQTARERLKTQFSHLHENDYYLDFKVYGNNGASVFGGYTTQGAREVAIIIDAVGKTPELADAICGFVRSTLLHYGYKGRISTAGNLAFPFSPSDFRAGEVYEFNVYCLLPASPLEHFTITEETV